MKRIEIYRACDGKDFATEKECLDYENAVSVELKIKALIMAFTSDVSLQFKFARFFQENKDAIREILASKATDEDVWISNECNSARGLPYSVERGTFIEVQKRNGYFKRDYAENWFVCWKSTDNTPHDIIKYRVIND